jgi:hypothetical protein
MLAASAIFALVALSTPTQGQHANPLLERGIRQVMNLDEASAVRTLEQARLWKGTTPPELARTYLWLGMAYAGLNQVIKARESFRAALVLEPSLQLPPGTSPRIRSWWRESGGTNDAAVTPPPVSGPSVISPPAAAQKAVGQDIPQVLQPEPPAPSPTWLPSSSTHEIARGGASRSRPVVRWLGVGLCIVGLGAVVAGAIGGARSQALLGESRAAPAAGESTALLTTARHDAQVANVLFATGGAVMAGGAGLALFSW